MDVHYSEYQGPVSEWTDILEATGFVNPDISDISPYQLRMATNSGRVKAAKEAMQILGLHEHLQWQDYAILTQDYQNIIARVYRPHTSNLSGLPIYLYFHGGGHLFGNIDTEDASCSRIVAQLSLPVIVVSINYRHTPEHPHPAQIDDAWSSFLWLSRHASELGGDPSKIILGGVSAGAGLAASIVLRNSEYKLECSQAQVQIKGLMLCSPWLIHPKNNHLNAGPSSSFAQNQNAPILPWPALNLYASLLGQGAIEDPYFNVGNTAASNLTTFPKTSLLVAGQDLLRDEALHFGEKLQSAGIPTKTHVFPGLPHGFRRFTQSWSADRWEELILEGIRWCLSDERASSFSTESKPSIAT